MALYAFNGTWNEEQTDNPETLEDETVKNTNVVRLKSAYTGTIAYSSDGVGTRFGRIGRVVGGAFGIGGQVRLAEAIDALHDQFEKGDRTIDIVGFSRGAALALAFANRINKRVKGPDGKPAKIRFLGLFDVVGSFGFPLSIGPLDFQEYNIGYNLHLPSNVEYCFHAMALDERRETFRVTRLKGAYEVWFRGAHSDVGGGNENFGLNNIALCWMLLKARACGLPVPESKVLEAKAKIQAAAAVKFSSFDPKKDAFRGLAMGDRVHYTVQIPCGCDDYFDPPADCTRETIETEVTVERNVLFS